MRRVFLGVVLLASQALVASPRAQEADVSNSATVVPAPTSTSTLVAPAEPPPYPSSERPASPAQAAEAAEGVATTNPIVELVRAKLSDPVLTKGANGDDLAALERFYAARSEGPMWLTEMGLSNRALAVVSEIAKADDWGLDGAAFDLPSASALPASAEAQALAEVKLGLAILKYARYARGGRITPATVSRLLDQTLRVRNPQIVLAEIAAAPAPDRYLQMLHPKHEQFKRLRRALLEARRRDEGGTKPNDRQREVKRLILNMERWRWMPETLGRVYVWNNSPEFMLYVIKDGKQIFADKTLVGTPRYATPVFSADMKTIVFNPDWVAPATVVAEDLLPQLRRGNYSILRAHKLQANYQGRPVDPSQVNWGRINVNAYSFIQKAGPDNVLGKVKFLFPNRHTVYLHDTVPARRKHFKEPTRMLGHECVRMEKPQQLAEVLLSEDKGWSRQQVMDLWNNGRNSSISINGKIPVHMTYFTAVADDDGKVSTFADVYGLDRKLAIALFGDAKGFPVSVIQPNTTETATGSSGRAVGSLFGGIAR